MVHVDRDFDIPYELIQHPQAYKYIHKMKVWLSLEKKIWLSYIGKLKSLGDRKNIFKIIFDRKCFLQLGIDAKNNWLKDKGHCHNYLGFLYTYISAWKNEILAERFTRIDRSIFGDQKPLCLIVRQNRNYMHHNHSNNAQESSKINDISLQCCIILIWPSWP